MDRQSALQYVDRWNQVDEIDRETHRLDGFEVKHKQLQSLFRIGRKFGWLEKPNTKESTIWERWSTLKDKFEEISRK